MIARRLATLLAVLTLVAGSLALAPARPVQPAPTTQVRFTAVALTLDARADTLGAYQLEFSATGTDARIVGVEGGDGAYAAAPYFDPRAIQQDRVIIAAMHDPATPAPAGATRVATVHLMITGNTEPDYELNLVTAADPDGRPITPAATMQTGAGT